MGVPALEYTRHAGYLPRGSDVANGSMTIGTAQKLCDSIVLCQGFTLGPKPSPNHEPVVWLKASDEWTPNTEGHTAYVKKRPLCDDAVYRRFRAEGHGPYCCVGDDCPTSSSEHLMRASACTLPAWTPNGLPRCRALRGSALRNLARAASSTSSPAYSNLKMHAAAAAHDGTTSGSRMFHSECTAGEPSWWRLSWTESQWVSQIVLHNRDEFKHRLIGSNVTLRAANGTVIRSLAVPIARSMFVWTFDEPAAHVSSLEVRRQGGDCLHFLELEAFGASQAEIDSETFRPARVPPRAPSAGRAELPTQPQPAAAEAGASTAAASPVKPKPTPAAPASRRQAAAPAEPAPAEAAPAERAAGVGGVVRGAVADDDAAFVWALSAGSVTLTVLVVLQAVWVKSVWLDLWR